MTKISWPSHLKKEGLFGSQLEVQSIMMGKPRQRELEVAAHIASTIRKRRAVKASLLCAVRISAQGMVPHTVGLSTHLN